MAVDDSSLQSDGSGRAGRAPLAPAAKKRLQKCFEHASKQITQSNHDYATELLSQCILGDPGNVIYVRNFVENLQKKYNNNKKGAALAQFKERGARGALKKAETQERWDDVIKNGLQVLQVNPWDIPTLRSMANAASHSGDGECELYYLNCALQTNPKDPETNIQCANAAAERGQFDQAIACWHRVEQARPNDDEAQRAIADLAVRKTITQGGYESADHGKKLKGGGAAKGAAAAAAGAEEENLSEEQLLRRRIAKEPQTLSHYFQLAQLYVNNDQHEAAEALFAQASEVSGGDLEVREHWLDAQVRHLRYKAALARQRQHEHPEADREFRQLRKQLYEKEVEYYTFLTERYPNTVQYRYELAVRYTYVRQYNDAIREFQQSRNDPRFKGLCMLGLGRCFQAIKQYGLAKNHYESAIEEIPDREMANKKEALYLAGKMALELKDIPTAEKHLTTLAGIDFTYKDVSELLGKIAELKEGNPSGDDKS
jgi:hypothetical protein